MSLADVTSARSSPAPDACPECDTSASVTSDLHKYQVACTCKPTTAQYACAEEPGPPPPAKADVPPALPPRPPASALAAGRRTNAPVSCSSGRRRKYAWWCVGCGALAAALGGLLAAQHILLRAYTASPHHLETVPAAVPAAMLVLTGVCIMSLARRRNRYSYMIKVVGACCLVCALTCVLVTITTTVIHMNKLQTLKFCEYTIRTRTCTCFSMPPDVQHSGDDEGVRCAFEGVSECGVVHGALYWCLRGVFALSVAAVLVCLFSSMLAYQLLSHERKKMYWEQLELRCRSLYRGGVPGGGAGGAGGAGCACCQGQWGGQHRFWAPGRIGNLYSPNPGSARKTSAWSWFPWPRGNSQNSRSCRMGGVPQSGDSAYGFCETDNPQPVQNPNPTVPYEDRPYPYPRNQGNFVNQGNFTNQGNFGNQGNQGTFGNLFEGYGESSGSFDAQTGVWGPPPPYSPQGRSGSRHHLHQDPATTTLLHHHHIDVHRNSVSIHQHPNIASNFAIQHACRNSSYIPHIINPELAHLNPEVIRLNPELAHLNPEMIRCNPELAHLNPEIIRLNPDIARLQEMVRLNPELIRMNPGVFGDGNVVEMTRLGPVLGPGSVPDGRFNTLRGQLVAYPACQRGLGMSVGNLHRDCRLPDENMTIECLHQKSVSKVSDQSSDSSQKLGKENLAFQNDKHSPVTASNQDGHRASNLNAESEVYFADVSSCCNVSIKADCCMKPNPTVLGLVGTIENHPESTSESDTGSFTRQRPQPQTTGSKRRPRNTQTDKLTKNMGKLQDINNSIRLTEQQIDYLNNSLCNRMSEHARMNEGGINDSRMCERMNDHRMDRMNDPRMSEKMNESRMSDMMMDARMSDRMNDSRMSDKMMDRMSDRMNDSRISDKMMDRMSDRMSDRMNDSRMIERMNESRMSERMNDSRVSDRMNDSRVSDRMNDSRMSERMHDTRMSDRTNDTRKNDTRMSDRHCDLSRMNEMRKSDHSMLDERRMELDLKSSPKMRNHMSPLRKMAKSSPKNVPLESPLHLRQTSTDSNVSIKNTPEFFVPPPPKHSPLTPNTEESVISDDEDRPRNIECFKDQGEGSKCLGPDSQYEPAREEKNEVLKSNHHHSYSDTNTMDSGWQSGSEKHATD